MPESDLRKRSIKKKIKSVCEFEHDLKRIVLPSLLFHSQAAFVEGKSGYYFAAYVASTGLAIHKMLHLHQL
jgi:hypothetical protein